MVGLMLRSQETLARCVSFKGQVCLSSGMLLPVLSVALYFLLTGASLLWVVPSHSLEVLLILSVDAQFTTLEGGLKSVVLKIFLVDDGTSFLPEKAGEREYKI